MLAQTISNDNNDLGFLSKNAFFDWYGASIHIKDPQSIIDIAMTYFVGDYREAKPQKPYLQAFEMFCGEDVIFKVSHGGINPNPYLVASSNNSSRVSEFLKLHFPNHSVSRFDTAIDFDETGAWKSLVDLGFYLAEKYNLKVNQMGDWRDEGKGGRTLYIGSRTSVTYLRIYEKGKEQIQKLIDVDASKNWVRVELEVKPQNKGAKAFASKMKPHELFGSSKWGIELGELLGQKGIPRIKLGTIHEAESELDKRMAYMLYQYGKTIEDILESRLDGCTGDLGGYLLDRMEWAKLKVAASKEI